MPVAALAAPLLAGGLEAAGLGATAAGIGGALGGAGISAGLGAGLGALTGQGAAGGALTGGIGGLAGEAGGFLGNLAGFPGIGQAVGGALGGALGSTLGGGSPLVGGIEGLALGGPASMVGGSGGFGGGIGTAVPAEATSGAVQPLGTPALTSATPLTGGSQLASDLNAAPATSGNVGTIDPVTDVSGAMTGPQAGSDVYTGANYMQPTASGTGDLQAPSTTVDPGTGAAAPTPLVGPTRGTMTPPYGLTPTPVPVGDQFGGGGGPSGTYAPGSTWQTVTNPADIASLSPDPYQAAGAYQTAGGAPSSPLGSIAGMLKNPAGLLTAGLAGYQALTAKRDMAKELQPLERAQTGAAGMSTALTAPSMTGVLPVGQQQALENERRKQYTAIEGQAAKTGMSGTTMERDAKMQANADIAARQVGIENQLLEQARGYAGLAGTEADQLIRDQMTQDQAYANALSKFVSGLGSAFSGNTGTKTTATA